MGKISIFVLLTIFTFHNIKGEGGNWLIVQVCQCRNNMFHALTYLLIDDGDTRNTQGIYVPRDDTLENSYVAHIRKQVADEIKKNPSQYDSRLRGKSIEEYCNEMSQAVSRGGGLELEILSKLYKMQIIVCDLFIENVRIYGGDDGASERLFLLYSKDHVYSALERTEKNAPSQDINGNAMKIFAISDDRYLAEILKMAQKPANYSVSAAEASADVDKKRKV